MPKFFVPPESIQKDWVKITGDDARHISKVLRKKKGDIIEVSDGKKDFKVVLDSIDIKTVKGKIIAQKSSKQVDVEIVLLQGIPKAKKMDLVIQKATELGVKKIVPVITERTVVKLDSQKSKNKHRRWTKIAKEAAKQSGRSIIPRVEPVMDLDDALLFSKDADLALIPWEKENNAGLKSFLTGKAYERVVILIGPEGGFSSEEVDKAARFKFKPVTLGPRILRTETAGIFLLSVIMYELGDMGGIT